MCDCDPALRGENLLASRQPRAALRSSCASLHVGATRLWGYPSEVPRPLIPLCGKAWRCFSALKICRKNVQGRRLCPACSSHRQPAAERGARGRPPCFRPGGAGLRLPDASSGAGRCRQGRAPARRLRPPSASAPAWAGWGEIPSTKPLILEPGARPDVAACASVRPSISVPPRCSKR